ASRGSTIIEPHSWPSRPHPPHHHYGDVELRRFLIEEVDSYFVSVHGLRPGAHAQLPGDALSVHRRTRVGSQPEVVYVGDLTASCGTAAPSHTPSCGSPRRREGSPLRSDPAARG